MQSFMQGWTEELGVRNPFCAEIFDSNALYVPFGDELPHADKEGCAILYDTALWRMRSSGS